MSTLRSVSMKNIAFTVHKSCSCSDTPDARVLTLRDYILGGAPTCLACITGKYKIAPNESVTVEILDGNLLADSIKDASSGKYGSLLGEIPLLINDLMQELKRKDIVLIYSTDADNNISWTILDDHCLPINTENMTEGMKSIITSTGCSLRKEDKTFPIAISSNEFIDESNYDMDDTVKVNPANVALTFISPCSHEMEKHPSYNGEVSKRVVKMTLHDLIKRGVPTCSYCGDEYKLDTLSTPNQNKYRLKEEELIGHFCHNCGFRDCVCGEE